MQKILIFVCVFFGGLQSGLAAADKGEVTIAYAYAPPLIYKGATGTPQGYYASVLHDVMGKQLGYRLKYVGKPWKRSQADVRHGLADIMITVPTPERRTYAHVIEPAIYRFRFELYTRLNHEKFKDIGQVQGIEGLLNLNMGTVTNIGNGWYQAHIAGAGVQTQLVPDLTHGFLLVKEGRADIVVAQKHTGDRIIRQLGLKKYMGITGGILDGASAHIHISKKSFLAKSRDKVATSLKAAIEDGRLSRYREQAFSAYHQQSAE